MGIYIKKPKTEFIFILTSGIVLFVAAIIALFVFFRPFVKWEKIVCDDRDVVYDETGEITTVTYTYEMYGILYKKTFVGIYGSNHEESDNIRRRIYVNPENPEDVKRGSLGEEFLGFMIGFIVLGAFLTYFSFRLYKKRIKDQIAQKQEQETNSSKAGTGNRRNKKGDNDANLY